MKITVKRTYYAQRYTIGALYVDGVRYIVNGRKVDTLEDTNRDFNRNGRFDGAERKVYGETCIPFGRYVINLDYSPKFSRKSAYRAIIRDGKMPHICNVPSFDGILIHGGNTPSDTYGCLLVGYNTIKGGLTQSLSVFRQLYADISAAIDRREDVTIEFV